MGYQMELGGEVFQLETAAISCVRYRAEYGESAVAQLAACQTAQALEGLLVRLCHSMIPPGERPVLLEFAGLCRREGSFIRQALAARDALLAPDPQHSPGDAGDGEAAEDFDEYKVLALAVAAGVDMVLLYELPILHLVAVIDACFHLKGGAQAEYRPMTQTEMAKLYPR